MNNLGSLTRGVKTSEFWAVLIPFLTGVASHAGLHITSDAIVAAAEAAASVYAVVRTFLKNAHIKSVASVSNVLTSVGQVIGAADEGAKAVASQPPAPIVSAPVSGAHGTPVQ